MKPLILIAGMVVSAILGILCIFVHAVTYHYDNASGVLYEPYFFMLVIGGFFGLISFVFLCVFVVIYILRILTYLKLKIGKN